MLLLTIVAAAFSEYEIELAPESRGASFTAVIATVLCTTLLKALLAPPSFTSNEISRALTLGLSLLFAYFTACSAASNCAIVPELFGDESVNTPVELLKLAVIFPVLAFGA